MIHKKMDILIMIVALIIIKKVKRWKKRDFSQEYKSMMTFLSLKIYSFLVYQKLKRLKNLLFLKKRKFYLLRIIKFIGGEPRLMQNFVFMNYQRQQKITF
jgi:hypothetical protein